MELNEVSNSFWETKFRSAEKSIEFLQLQHTQTLKSLHDQIEDLQKNCSDLSFKLSFHATTQLEKEEFDKLQQSFNVKMKQKDDLIAEQIQIVNVKDKTIEELQDKIKNLEKQLNANTKLKDETIRQLRLQIDQQNSKLAELSFQYFVRNSQEKFKKNDETMKKSICSSSNENVQHEPKIIKTFQINNNTPPKSGKINLDKHYLINGSTIKRNFSREDTEFSQKSVQNHTNYSRLPTRQNIETLLTNKTSISLVRRNSNISDVSTDNNPSLQTIKKLPLKKPNSPIIQSSPFLPSNLLSNSNDQLFTPSKRVSLPPIKSLSKIHEFAVDLPIKSSHNSIINGITLEKQEHPAI